MSKIKVIVLISIVAAITGGILAFLFASGKVDIRPVTRAQADAAYALLRNSLTNPLYTYTDFLTDNPPVVRARNEITVQSGVVLGEGESVEFNVDVPEGGLYFFRLEYNALDNSFTDITIALRVNGELQYSEAKTIILPVFWEDESKVYPIDKYGDETAPMQRQIPGPHTVSLFDTRYTMDLPLNFLLSRGENIIEINNETSKDLWLGDLTAYSYREPAPYKGGGGSYLNIST